MCDISRALSQKAWTGDAQPRRPDQTGLKSNTRAPEVYYTWADTFPSLHQWYKEWHLMPGPDSFVYMQREEAVSMAKAANVSVKRT